MIKHILSVASLALLLLTVSPVGFAAEKPTAPIRVVVWDQDPHFTKGVVQLRFSLKNADVFSLRFD